MKEKKLKNIILYLLNRSGKMTKDKLTFLLYFLEFDYYEKHDKKLIGLKFVKTINGIKIL